MCLSRSGIPVHDDAASFLDEVECLDLGQYHLCLDRQFLSLAVPRGSSSVESRPCVCVLSCFFRAAWSPPLPALLLLEEMGYIAIEDDKIQVVSILNDYGDEEEFATHFSEILVDYLVDEEVISLDSLKYRSQEDCFILARNGIKYKHASYRNLLLSLGILTKQDDGSYLFEKKLDKIVEIAPTKTKRSPKNDYCKN